ncbi:MAG: DegT/DnrJ/EryC1/StrS family aminotransferase [Bacteroidetes bacterium]|nr:DegT/DnrJ/EryC1/StrS family aminotransferase [Bacteroidota bacterium]
MINVTKTFFPPLKEYNEQLERVWKNEWLTNRGELVKELEEKLETRFNVSSALLMNNGTIPIQLALRLLAHKGEVITTPFTYVATTASIVWEYCTPVFVDIEPDTFSLNANLIEAAINEKTTAILATHVFGNPCDVDAIGAIANKHNLPVIYDAAHCFDVTYKGKSLFHYGDVSTGSFHATKLFHTGEGGVVFCKNPTLFSKIDYSHKFGHDGPLDFKGLGINGKMSELQAAMGLSVLPYMEKILASRKSVVDGYNAQLNFSKVTTMRLREDTEWNYCYYPIVFSSEEKLLQVEQALKENGITPRRYFYPSLNNLPYVTRIKMPVSDAIAKTILCLPLSHALTNDEVKTITSVVNKSL